MDKFITLSEAARDLRTDVESLIRTAACGDLTLFAIADKWAVRHDDDTSPDELTGPVYLLAEDLLQGVGAEFTPVRQVQKPENEEVLTLRKSVKVLRGGLYVTAEEFHRFRRENALLLDIRADTAPYLNPDHEWYSPKLAAAVNAWMALFADGNFQKGHGGVIDQVEGWLMANNKDDLSPTARGYIAKVVNPKKTKDGGALPKMID